MQEVHVPGGHFSKFFNIWASFRRDGETVPLWPSVKPMAFGDLLTDVMLVRKNEDGEYRFRLLGSAINQRMGSDPVGQSILSLMHPRVHEYILRWFDLVITQPCGAISDADILFERPSNIRVKSICLPIADASGKIDTFMYWNDIQGLAGYGNFGAFRMLGAKYFMVEAVDIGAGVPEGPAWAG
ncbi:PAS domain-containing protein [Kordiimonas marina]|uniref:PAS domain-containing protein n=1 Tax=Kordiimonas marina TaxID=2872312 RepID=UPI00248C8CA1|nr:PAS domain-containing protein [Kordiimonas marina]MCJ9428289.1 PAS domain-containing protein [Kordiimonas marina]